MLDLNSPFSCREFSSSGLTGMCHHTWLRAGMALSGLLPCHHFFSMTAHASPLATCVLPYSLQNHICAELLICSCMVPCSWAPEQSCRLSGNRRETMAVSALNFSSAEVLQLLKHWLVSRCHYFTTQMHLKIHHYLDKSLYGIKSTKLLTLWNGLFVNCIFPPLSEN